MDFRTALEVFSRSSLLEEAQQAYGSYIDPEPVGSITIRQTGPGSYLYINRQGYVSYIRELSREISAEAGSVGLTYYMTTARFFGRFHGLIRIDVRDLGAAGIGYNIGVTIYIENPFVRYCALRVSPVRTFLEKRTQTVIENLTDGCWALCVTRSLDDRDRPVLPTAQPVATAARDVQTDGDK